MSWPLDDRLVQHAVSHLLERSERQPKLEVLQATFVDPGIAIRLSNANNQIVFGRRGTGKTHVLKVLEHEAHGDDESMPIYIDMRTLGSSALWEDVERPAFVRVGNLLKDVLSEIQNALLDYATQPTTQPPGRVLESLSALAEAITWSVVADERVTHEEEQSNEGRSGSGFELEAAVRPRIRIRGDEEDTNRHTLKIVREGRPLERIHFKEIAGALQRVLADAGINRLLILLDEWTAVPAELQPLLAEFIKRSLFPYSNVTVKIGAVEYRCHFGVPLANNNTLGFELTADVSATLVLDEFFIFDRDELATERLFAEVLFRHVAVECDRYWLISSKSARDRHGRAPTELVRQYADRRLEEPGFYLRERFGIKEADAFVAAFFDRDETFRELARAGEGVARDFLSLFQDACFETLRRRRARLDIASVRQVAREWFAQEKIKNVDSRQREILNRIVAEVVGRHKSRSFLFDAEFERSEVVRSLFDLRLIHLIKRGFIPDDELAHQYNVYTLDYGTYVGALGTERAPTGDFSRDRGDDAPLVVPFHDDRAIKRIVLPPNLLEGEYAAVDAT